MNRQFFVVTAEGLPNQPRVHTNHLGHHAYQDYGSNSPYNRFSQGTYFDEDGSEYTKSLELHLIVEVVSGGLLTNSELSYRAHVEMYDPRWYQDTSAGIWENFDSYFKEHDMYRQMNQVALGAVDEMYGCQKFGEVVSSLAASVVGTNWPSASGTITNIDWELRSLELVAIGIYTVTAILTCLWLLRAGRLWFEFLEWKRHRELESNP
ncbi:MAG: hypothetical protein ACF8GE_05605 [Phycisphaerales bacterium JB043]